jgi:hypothetical protein
VDEPAEAIAPLDRPGRQRVHFSWLTGSALVDPLVRPGVEVMVDEFGQHFLQMTAAAFTWSSTSRHAEPTQRSE